MAKYPCPSCQNVTSAKPISSNADSSLNLCPQCGAFFLEKGGPVSTIQRFKMVCSHCGCSSGAEHPNDGALLACRCCKALFKLTIKCDGYSLVFDSHQCGSDCHHDIARDLWDCLREYEETFTDSSIS